MPWMAALDVWACGGVVIVVILSISLQLGGHDDEGSPREREVGDIESMVHMWSLDLVIYTIDSLVGALRHLS